MALGGRRKPLKRLDSNKEIKVNSFDLFGRALPDSTPIWLNLGPALIFLGQPPPIGRNLIDQIKLRP
jgi:hypothetical protein